MESKPTEPFIFLEPQEAFRNGFIINKTIVGECDGAKVGIIRYPDVDVENGMKGVNVAIIYNPDNPNSSPFEKFTELGLKTENTSLTDKQKGRLDECRNRLKLPWAVAITLMDSEEDLSQWITSDIDVTTKLISVTGLIGSGKSMVAAYLSTVLESGEVDFFSLDKFSKTGIEDYVKAINEAGLDDKSSAEDILKVMVELKNSERPKKSGSARSLKNTAMELALKFKDGKRPKYMLIDGPGDKNDSQITANAYHMFGSFSCDVELQVETPDLLNRDKINFDQESNLEFAQENPPLLIFHRRSTQESGIQTGDVDIKIRPGSLQELKIRMKQLLEDKL